MQFIGLLLALGATLSGSYGVLLFHDSIGQLLTFQTLSLLALGAVVSIISLMLMLFFRKTPNPEVSFYVLGMQALALHSLRPLIYALVQRGTVWTITATLSRVVHFGNLLFLLALFISGLFASGLTLQRRTIMLSTSLFIAFTLSALLPIDISALTRRMLFRSGLDRGILIGSIILSVLGVVNYFMASVQQENRRHIALGVGLFFTLLGGYLVFYLPIPFSPVAGTILIILGSYIFGSRAHQIYLWL